MKPLGLLMLAVCVASVSCGGGSSSNSPVPTSGPAPSPSPSPSPTPSPPPASTFTLSSSAAAEGGALPADHTCDGTGSSPPLSWSDAPAGTKEFAVLLKTLPGDGTTKYNWVLHSLPATTSTLARNSYGTGTAGVGSDGPFVGYQAPCSQGTGTKVYTFTVYALSGSPSLTAGTAVSGAALLMRLRHGTGVVDQCAWWMALH